MLRNTKEKLKNFKIFTLIFIGLFLIVFLIINWNEFCWIFNQKIVLSAIFNSPKEDISKEKTDILNVQLVDTIKIPKLGLEAPIVFPKDNSFKEIDAALKKGVIHFPTSSLPGEKGTSIILGHSAPPGWPKINYNWIFSSINELEEGDEVFVVFNNKEYQYLVKEKNILPKGEEVPKFNESKANLVLLTCWPPGKDYKRIFIRTELNE